MVRLEKRDFGVRVHARRLEQPPLGADEGEIRLGRGAPPGCELVLAQRDHVLGQGEPFDNAPEPCDRRPEPTAGRVDARQPRVRRRVAGELVGGAAVGKPGRGEIAALELEVTEERLDVGDILGLVSAGGHGVLHGGEGAGQVAVQLAQVGHARVGGEVRLEVDHALERPGGGAVAAELDLGVDNHAVWAHDLTREPVRRHAPCERRPEVFLLSVQALEPFALPGSEELWFGALPEGQKESEESRLYFDDLAGLAKAVESILTDCFQHAVTRATVGVLQNEQ